MLLHEVSSLIFAWTIVRAAEGPLRPLSVGKLNLLNKTKQRLLYTLDERPSHA